MDKKNLGGPTNAEEAGRGNFTDATVSNGLPTLVALATPIELPFHLINHRTPHLEMFPFSH